MFEKYSIKMNTIREAFKADVESYAMDCLERFGLVTYLTSAKFPTTTEKRKALLDYLEIKFLIKGVDTIQATFTRNNDLVISAKVDDLETLIKVKNASF